MIVMRQTFLMIAALSLLAAPVRADEKALDGIHRKIVTKYGSVRHITSDVLTRRLADQSRAGDILLIDVREVDEHAVSHLDGALQMTPGIWTSTFMRKFGDRISGKTVVFYCSVGRRSSYAASYLQDALKANGATDVLNLKGGIFSWHNQSRPLKSAGESTDFVHPFDSYWGRLLERHSLARMKPVPPSSTDLPSLSTKPDDASSAATPTSQ